MNIPALLTSAIFIGAVVVVLLLVDAVASALEVRRLGGVEGVGRVGPGESGEPAALHRERLRGLRWTVMLAVALAVIIAFGADSAARAVWDDDRPVAGALLLLGVTLVTVVVGAVAVTALQRREPPSYARIRRDLRDRSSSAMTADELRIFEERLERADRARSRRSQSATVVRAVGVAVLLGLAILAALTFPLGAAALFGAAAVLGVVALIVAVRSELLLAAALDAALDAQRAEVLTLLERARIPARGRIPGLGGRVARALAILRERQK